MASFPNWSALCDYKREHAEWDLVYLGAETWSYTVKPAVYRGANWRQDKAKFSP